MINKSTLARLHRLGTLLSRRLGVFLCGSARVVSKKASADLSIVSASTTMDCGQEISAESGHRSSACISFDKDRFPSHPGLCGDSASGLLPEALTHSGIDAQAPELSVWRLAELARNVFDFEWYAAQNPDVIEAGYEPLDHYLKYGREEGRPPSQAASELAALAELGRESFDADWYAINNPDVIEAGFEPLQHYLLYGRREGRPAKPHEDKHYAGSSVDREALRWYYVGDTVEWIARHAHLTGVGRVTLEILFAGLAEVDTPFIPCVKGSSPSGLVRLRDWTVIVDLARSAGRSPDEAAAAERSASLIHPLAEGPMPGDHVIFTGVIWTPNDAMLFRRLVSRNVTFSVLIHDIIPIMQPKLVGEAHARSFTDWFSITVQMAALIYVSTGAVARDVARWVVASRSPSTASIKQIVFGLRAIPPCPNAIQKIARKIGEGHFVLSVGTIDERKNQLFLCQVWRNLLDQVKVDQMPQLVLVGRDDVDLPSDQLVGPLIRSGSIIILSGLNDVEVAALYRACLFTVFPSTSEGYGLPVAESLSHGKLCVSSDLPAVRSHAGDLVWYFNPASRDDALAQIARAILKPEQRIVAEARIRAEHKPTPWSETVRSIVEAADRTIAGQRIVEPGLNPYFEVAKSEAAVPRAISSPAELSAKNCPEVSIVIVNRNTSTAALECVRQIWTHTQNRSYEIILVDNGSDETDLRHLQILAPLATLIELGCDRFEGEAYNIAGERARGRYLCFLDATVDVVDGWLQTAMQALEDDGTAAAIELLPLRSDCAGRVPPLDAALASPSKRGHDVAQEAAWSVDLAEVTSAAVLIVEREVFLTVGGFDLAYEPGLYEDVDLCLKIQGSGRKALRAKGLVKHRDGVPSDSTPIGDHLIRDLNRSKLQARWGKDLRGGEWSASLHVPAAPPVVHDQSHGSSERGLPRAILYTPYPLTPGGGERYLLSMAALLTQTHAVTLALPHLYSKLRIVTLGAEFGLNLKPVAVEIATAALVASQPDILITMNNQIVPAIAPFGKRNFFICQFPFPMDGPVLRADKDKIAGYQKILAYSRYTAINIESKMHSLQAAAVPICLVPPPVKPMRSSVKRSNTIMTVGRFFVGGHAKRHDVLIEAFKALQKRFAEPVELHVVGSTTPLDMHMSYLQDLIRSSAGYPIHFHVNIQAEALEDLYASTAVYWHGAGLGVDLDAEPWAAEHFGISVVEAMTAGVVPFALASGGPREIIRHAVDGFLYDSLDSLVDQTAAFLASDSAHRDALSATSRRRGEDFSPEVFAETVRRVILEEASA